MNRIVAIIFNKASQAAKARDALKSLDRDESITLFGYAILAKDTECIITISEQYTHRYTHRTPAGSAIDSVIAMLNQPVSILSANEHILGAKANSDDLQVNADFVRDVSHAFVPGKAALLADIDEEWTPWVDLRMEKLGGIIFRCPLSDVKEAVKVSELASMQAELARLKAEHARADANQKSRLYKKVNALDTKIQQQLENAKKRHEAAETEAENTAEALEKAAQRFR